MRLRNTVQEQQRRPVAASDSMDRRTRGRDVELFESVEHGLEPPRDSRTVLSCRNWRSELTMNLSCRLPAKWPPACRRHDHAFVLALRPTQAFAVLRPALQQTLDPLPPPLPSLPRPHPSPPPL